MFWFVIGLALSYIIYQVILHYHHYWTKRNVPQQSLLATFKDYWNVIARREDICSRLLRFDNEFKDSRYYGMYFMGSPALIIRDPELIKQLTIKDFDHFLNHDFFTPDHDELWSKALISLKGQQWKEMRSTISPIFTSSKIKKMFLFMEEVADEYCKFYLKQDQEIVTVEMKDSFTRFANDVIANTVFGVKCNSLEDPENEFYKMGLKVTNFTDPKRVLVLLSLIMLPRLSKLLRFKLFPPEVVKFFEKVVHDNLEQREKENIIRPDLMHLLIQTRKGTLKEEEQADHHEYFQKVKKVELTEQDILAQCLTFFLAGFDSVSSLMCFMAHELAVNPDIQDRLRQEIDDIADVSDGKPTYDKVIKMKYMDMILSETLRRWTPTAASDRSCTKSYTIEPVLAHERPVKIDEGTSIWFTSLPIHLNPAYFPDPMRFDPERFSDENKENIRPGTFIPFGSGPRSCIGSRFALIEAKVLFFYLLRRFEIVPVEKTQIPLRLSKVSATMSAEKGFWLGLKRRHNVQ